MKHLDKGQTNRKHHYLETDNYKSNLEFLIEGIEYSINRIVQYNKEATDGLLDLEIELEGAYGLALIAMQNYINLTLVDCFTASNINSDTPKEKLHMYKEKLRTFSQEAYKNDYMYESGETKVQLIVALANSYKHRNDLELYIDKIYSNKELTLSESEKYKKGYNQNTSDVLNAFNLLESDDWEIYPVINGMKILDNDFNLRNIINHLLNSWRPRMWEQVYESLKNNPTFSPDHL